MTISIGAARAIQRDNRIHKRVLIRACMRRWRHVCDGHFHTRLRHTRGIGGRHNDGISASEWIHVRDHRGSAHAVGNDSGVHVVAEVPCVRHIAPGGDRGRQCRDMTQRRRAVTRRAQCSNGFVHDNDRRSRPLTRRVGCGHRCRIHAHQRVAVCGRNAATHGAIAKVPCIPHVRPV